MPSDAPIKQVPLDPEHRAIGAKMVEFGGWLMPVQYKGILSEHHAVRQSAGLFDISHMGELKVTGTGALEWLNGLLTNDLSALKQGEGQYSLMLNERGGVIDDLILYRTEADGYYLVINASKIDEVIAWLGRHPGKDVTWTNQSDVTCGLALQGPASEAILRSLVSDHTTLPPRNNISDLLVCGINCRVARTGYTGEDGFELFCDAVQSRALWNTILEKGSSHGLVPAGLGARDTLRLEACLPLNGHELTPDITPLEAGLNLFVKLDKPGDFIGKSALRAQKESGLKFKSIALSVSGQGPPPREGYPVFSRSIQVGEVTSGAVSPTLQKGIALARVHDTTLRPGDEIELEVRGRKVKAVVEKKPFYKKR